MTTNLELAALVGSSTYGPPVLAWIDLECTGLDPLLDDIIEITAIITNNQLDEIDRYTAVIAPTFAAYIRMMAVPIVVEMHTRNGLLAALADPSQTILVAEAEQAILAMLARHEIPVDQVILSVCGSGVGNHDIPFLRRQMPTLMAAASYFSACDVGVLRRSYGMWNGCELVESNNLKTHRSKDDIECHLAEARAFRHLLTAGHNLAAADMWRTALAADPEALDGINPVLTALNAIAHASGNATDVTPELDLDVDGIPMLHGSLLLNLHLLEREAERTGKTLAEVLDDCRNDAIDGGMAA